MVQFNDVNGYNIRIVRPHGINFLQLFLFDKINYSQYPTQCMKKIKGIFVLILALGCMNLFSDGHLASFIETALSPDSFSCETDDSVPGIGIDPTPNSVYLAIIDNDSDRKFLKLINKLQKFLDDMSDDDQNTLIVFANNHENMIARANLNAYTGIVLISYFYRFLVSRLDSTLPSDAAGGRVFHSIAVSPFNDMVPSRHIVFLHSNQIQNIS